MEEFRASADTAGRMGKVDKPPVDRGQRSRGRTGRQSLRTNVGRGNGVSHQRRSALVVPLKRLGRKGVEEGDGSEGKKVSSNLDGEGALSLHFRHCFSIFTEIITFSELTVCSFDSVG